MLAGAVASMIASIVGIGLVLALVSPALAHTTLLQASPGPGQRGGGTIEFIDLVFAEPVSEAVVTVTREEVEVPGSMLETDGQIIRFAFDSPVTEPGRYEVAYNMISFDLDESEASYFFDYVPDAPQPVRLGPVDTSGDSNLVPILAGSVMVVCLAGLAFIYLSRVVAGREAADGPDDDRPDDGHGGGHENGHPEADPPRR